MNLNSKQMKVVKACAAIIALMLIFPPFEYGRGRYVESAGYSLFMSAPHDGITAQIAIVTLLVQWVGVLIIGALLVLVFKDASE